MKSAIVTGVTGQDGSYLAEFLLEKGYRVIGLKRRTSTNTLDRIKHIENENFSVVECEISDSGSVYSIVDEYRPDEIYNLAAQSHVKTSFDQPEYTFQVNTIGVINFLEAIRRFSHKTKFYQASTSEMYGKNTDSDKALTGDNDAYQDEETVFEPQSPYAAAKLASHHLVRNYRDGYGIFGCCGILFNHESERRGENFVTRKITKWIADLVSWEQENALDLPSECRFCMREETIGIPGERMFIDVMKYPSFPKLRLGNIDAYRDWGHAQDYVQAMWLMLQQKEPNDYVIATGETHTVREFLKEAFDYIGIDNFEDYIVIDPKFYRPAEVNYLRGWPQKAFDELGWEPQITFTNLVQRMIESDINAKKEQIQQKEIS